MQLAGLTAGTIKTAKNSYVYKVGFLHAIVWNRKPPKELVKNTLSAIMGNPAEKYHYATENGRIWLKGFFYDQNTRWYYGTHQWCDDDTYRGRVNISYRPHMVAFRTEEDLLLARLALQ